MVRRGCKTYLGASRCSLRVFCTGATPDSTGELWGCTGAKHSRRTSVQGPLLTTFRTFLAFDQIPRKAASQCYSHPLILNPVSITVGWLDVAPLRFLLAKKCPFHARLPVWVFTLAFFWMYGCLLVGEPNPPPSPSSSSKTTSRQRAFLRRTPSLFATRTLLPPLSICWPRTCAEMCCGFLQ